MRGAKIIEKRVTIQEDNKLKKKRERNAPRMSMIVIITMGFDSKTLRALVKLYQSVVSTFLVKYRISSTYMDGGC